MAGNGLRVALLFVQLLEVGLELGCWIVPRLVTGNGFGAGYASAPQHLVQAFEEKVEGGAGESREVPGETRAALAAIRAALAAIRAALAAIREVPGETRAALGETRAALAAIRAAPEEARAGLVTRAGAATS